MLSRLPIHFSIKILLLAQIIDAFEPQIRRRTYQPPALARRDDPSWPAALGVIDKQLEKDDLELLEIVVSLEEFPSKLQNGKFLKDEVVHNKGFQKVYVECHKYFSETDRYSESHPCYEPVKLEQASTAKADEETKGKGDQGALSGMGERIMRCEEKLEPLVNPTHPLVNPTDPGLASRIRLADKLCERVTNFGKLFYSFRFGIGNGSAEPTELMSALIKLLEREFEASPAREINSDAQKKKWCDECSRKVDSFSEGGIESKPITKSEPISQELQSSKLRNAQLKEICKEVSRIMKLIGDPEELN